MVSPPRVLWTLAAVIGFATVPSFFAYWTHTLWVAKLMFWIYIPAIYFFIGPCMALVLNLAPSNMRSIFTAWSVLVGNVFNLIVAPQAVGIMSDFFAARPRRRCRLVAPGAACCLRRQDSGRSGIFWWPQRPWSRTRRAPSATQRHESDRRIEFAVRFA